MLQLARQGSASTLSSRVCYSASHTVDWFTNTHGLYERDLSKR